MDEDEHEQEKEEEEEEEEEDEKPSSLSTSMSILSFATCSMYKFSSGYTHTDRQISKLTHVCIDVRVYALINVMCVCVGIPTSSTRKWAMLFSSVHSRSVMSCTLTLTDYFHSLLWSYCDCHHCYCVWLMLMMMMMTTMMMMTVQVQ